MLRRALLLMAFCAAPGLAAAQSVELVFTNGVVQQAVALKGALKADKIESFSALALVGASPARKKAYADKVAGTTAVVILGEDALKAVADVEFTGAVIVLNATGPTAARGRVFRVFDGAAPAGASAVTSASGVTDLMAGGREVSLKGQAAPVIQAVLGAIK